MELEMFNAGGDVSLNQMIRGTIPKPGVSTSAPMNVTMPQITINATSSQPEAIAFRVRQAISDGIDQLKKMRNYEQRIGYV
jgi:hypothetical protein